ncbi:uncharacterized protein TM35_000023310 [Trypanosoma theileri]|uniref:Uncharacterized protein n=1 Tax=Trypanosoma theileri TaxID=67003 RepID=A0A1X0P839_9TRYP|nr:uncharacterized protein TM35_000023310 [Trypanosoma theileri]ORC93005.1 hypothetical protein TM35_000023310 [Trypanosoma theileri]
MFRRVIGPEASRALAKTTSSVRRYTNYDHMKYPMDVQAVACVFGYILVMWFVFARIGSLYTNFSSYKTDYLRVWRRKLGTGYQWADAWGPQMETLYRNVPDRVE